MKFRLSPSVLASIVIGAATASGQNADGNWDSLLGAAGVAGLGSSSSSVDAIHLFRGSVMVGGEFRTISSIHATNIAEWNGLKWSSLGDGMSRTGRLSLVSSLCSAGDVMYAGGLFTRAGATDAKFIGMWNGAEWMPVGGGLNGTVWALAGFGTNLFAGGDFTAAETTSALRIAMWDGSAWRAMGGLTNVDPYCVDGCVDDAAVYALAAKGSDLFVGGRFNYAGGVFATNIARWDGTNWHTVGKGLPDVVRALAFTDAGLYAAGDFSIARFDGTTWQPVGSGVSNNFSVGYVGALTVVGTDLYVGGSFTSAGGYPATNITKWTGSGWSPLGSGVGRGGIDGINALASNGTELFVGGIFATAGGKPATNIALWHIPHELGSRRTGNQLTLSWSSTGSNLVLECATSLPATNWQALNTPRTLVSNSLVVAEPITNSSRFFRLRR